MTMMKKKIICHLYIKFHMEDSIFFISMWNIASVGLIKGLHHIQITDGVSIFFSENWI